MINRLLSLAITSILQQVLQQKIREGSIKAVKGYIEVIKYARLATLGLLGLGIVAALLTTGIVLMIVGVVGLLPIEASTAAIVILAIGAVLTLVVGGGAYYAFQQKRWLEVSRAYELMDSVLAPWPGVLPPNPVDVIRGPSHSSHTYAHDGMHPSVTVTQTTPVPEPTRAKPRSPEPRHEEFRRPQDKDLSAQIITRGTMSAPIA